MTRIEKQYRYLKSVYDIVLVHYFRLKNRSIQKKTLRKPQFEEKVHFPTLKYIRVVFHVFKCRNMLYVFCHYRYTTRVIHVQEIVFQYKFLNMHTDTKFKSETAYIIITIAV